MAESKKLIDFKSAIKNPFWRAFYSAVSSPLESFLGIKDVNKIYDDLRLHPERGNFFDRALCSVPASYEVEEEDLNKIPKSGALIVVANHPLGGLDGISLGAMLLEVRKDTKLLGNYLLGRMEEIAPWLLPVNPFGGKEATTQNLSSMKECIRHLKNGGCIATFPSGTVSYFKIGHSHITDPEWNVNVAQLARRTNATILPVFFEGRNSLLFYSLGLIHPRLRTALLARELVRTAKKNTIRMRIGKPISPKKIAEFETDTELTAWLRLNTYMLGKRGNTEKPESGGIYSHIKNIKRTILPAKKKVMQDLILPRDPDEIQREIDSLPESACLINGDKVRVYYAYAYQIRSTMLEIGRLRERTFREVGEGTGRSVDIDEFDQYYLQIFMWDCAQKRIIGAYRVGRTDKIIPSMGVQGLYVSTLFKMKREFIEKIDPALEMGRSFIVSEYQKKRSTLAILWRGIGEYLSRHPKYRTLYGPVSINPEYNSISKDLIVQFLTDRKTSEELARLVKAKKPPKIRLHKSDKEALRSGVTDIDQVSALISEIEVDNKGIPTLLKHYLKLNGLLLAFNVDHEFGSCIDGLIVVDMTDTDPKLLKSYMGVEQAIKYRKYHGLESPELEEELARGAECEEDAKTI